jgi:hypothetical protein
MNTRRGRAPAACLWEGTGDLSSRPHENSQLNTLYLQELLETPLAVFSAAT